MADVVHPTRVVRFNLMVVLLGVALPFAISDVLANSSWPRILSLAAFLLMSLNFFHGKVSTVEDPDYNQALLARPKFALFDYVANITIVLSFVLMAFSMEKASHLVVANLVIRIVDLALVRGIYRITDNYDLRRAQRIWWWIDVCAVAGWGAAGAVELWTHLPNVTPVAFAIISAGDVVIDYTLNRKLYFSTGDSWEDLADLWDETQGEDGDIYRKEIIWPALASLDPHGGRVLDVGCGNGWMARNFARLGLEVTAIDGFKSMLDRARCYDSEGISYEVVDLNEDRSEVPPGPYKYIVACFTLQDLENLQGALSKLVVELAEHGEIWIVFEDETQLNSGNVHSTTTRRWLDPAGTPGRRQLISWEPRLLAHAAADGNGPSGGQAFSTVTKVWRADEYELAGQRLDLAPVEPVRILLPRETAPRSQVLRNYRAHPRFSLLRLRRGESPVFRQTASGVTSLVGSAEQR